MQNSQNYLAAEALARLEGLGLRAKRIVEGYVAGVHRSPYHGFSIEFAEHRKYVPGDDLRYLDWKVFGRTDKFYLKQFEEETNLLCHLLVDTSQSMLYRGPTAAMSKLQYAQTAAAALAYLVLHQQDSVGLATFDTQIREFVRASGNPSRLNRIVKVLEDAQPREKTATGQVFHDLAERLRRRGIVVVLSDLFDDVPSMLAGLKHLHHRRHEVIVLQIVDPAEVDFPFERPARFRGLEGEGDLTAEPDALRRAYLAEFDRFVQDVRRGCRAQRIDHLLVRTDDPPEVVLSGYLASRGRRR